MTLFNYLDNLYQKSNLELQKEYTPQEKAKTMAIGKIIGHQKNWYVFKFYFTVLFSYLKCVLTSKWPEKVDFMAELQVIQEAKKQQHSKDAECQAENVVQMSAKT